MGKGKSLADLHLDDFEIEVPDVREASWYQVVERIDELLESGDYDWAENTLQGIRKGILRFKSVTPLQENAIDNIEAGGQRHKEQQGRWGRRYEGY